MRTMRREVSEESYSGYLIMRYSSNGSDTDHGRKKQRLQTIDSLRGLTMVSMILYHFCWDLKYLCGFDMPWYGGLWSFIWQQSICWSFIMIAGFCMHFARSPIRNGVLVFLCGIIVSCVTILVAPEAQVMFGVLTLLGTSMILVGVAQLLLKSLIADKKEFVDPFFGFFTSVILFALTKTINHGYLSLGPLMMELPSALYSGSFMTFLGFMDEDFYSADYFSLMPWFFLFLVGYFLYGIIRNTRLFKSRTFHVKLPFFAWFGRFSLIVYMLHQVVLYGISMLIQTVTG